LQSTVCTYQKLFFGQGDAEQKHVRPSRILIYIFF
jgi:hypothetical protein